MRLSVKERLQFRGVIWDSIHATLGIVPFTEAHRAELDRRLEDDRVGPGAGDDWETTLKRVRTRVIRVSPRSCGWFIASTRIESCAQLHA